MMRGDRKTPGEGAGGGEQSATSAPREGRLSSAQQGLGRTRQRPRSATHRANTVLLMTAFHTSFVNAPAATAGAASP